MPGPDSAGGRPGAKLIIAWVPTSDLSIDTFRLLVMAVLDTFTKIWFGGRPCIGGSPGTTAPWLPIVKFFYYGRPPSDPAAFLNYQKRKQPSKLVVGRSATNKRLQSVVTTRKVDLFVSRLNPNTAAGELIDYAKSATTDVVIHDVACTRLQSKFEELYASFYVAITVDSVDLKRAVELFMAADSWPAGVFVKRYFKPKDGSS